MGFIDIGGGLWRSSNHLIGWFCVGWLTRWLDLAGERLAGNTRHSIANVKSTLLEHYPARGRQRKTSWRAARNGMGWT